MSTTFAYATRTADAPVTRGSAQVLHRCGGTLCPSETCDHDGELSRQPSLGTAPPVHGHGSVAPPAVHATLAGGGRPLDPAVLAFMEPRLGHNFGRVRIHDDAHAATSARAVGAQAYTVGSHIAFAAGTYVPGTEEGRRLIAHELVHTVQQGASPPQSVGLALVDQMCGQVLAMGATGARLAEGTEPAEDDGSAPTAQAKLTIGEPGDAFEREADQAADRVMRMPDPTAGPPGELPDDAGCCGGACREPVVDWRQPALVARSPVVMRQGGGRGGTQAAPDPVKNARAAAWNRTFRVYARLAGIGPPPPPGRERAAEYDERADQLAMRNLAATLFQWNPPNMDQITQIVGAMRDQLGPGLRTVRAPANDPECGTRDAYVVGLRPPVHLCPRFFRGSAEQQIKTMVHEAAHLAGIGEPHGESYCGLYDCASSCGGFDAADSWGHFVHCASGQTPQQTVVRGGRPGRPQQGQAPPGGRP